MNILAGNVFKQMMFNFAMDIYSTVIKVYELLISLVSTNASEGDNLYNSLSSISDIVYVLMGIFMLFRITVSFLNMLIDPDKVSDKQAGAGSIIKRVAISLVLLIVFQPGSFLFDWLDRIESAIIDPEEGLVSNITAEIGNVQIDNMKLDSIMFEDVNAADASSSSYECYYVSASKGAASASGEKYTYNIDGFTHIKIYNTSGLSSDRTPINGFWGSATGWYVESYNDTQTDNSGRTWTFTKLPTSGAKYRSNQVGSAFNSSYAAKSKCPPYIVKGNNNTFTFYSKNPEKDDMLTNTMYFLAGKSVDNIMDTIGVLGGDENSSGTAYTNISSFKYTSSQNAAEVEEMIENYAEYIKSRNSVFAQSLFRCFVDKLPTYNAENDEILDNVLYSEEANDEIYDLATSKTPQLNINYFLSIIVGIVVIVYLLLLCVEVIIRSFKLAILKVIAPIPIISYVDPKDKIFNNWIKMFFTVYVDLFIKLLCISLGVALLNSVVAEFGETDGSLVKLLFIIAVLVFIKAIPELIKKIFGFDMSGSSFKEIGKMAKTALGVGAGAVAGAGAGLISGIAAGAAVKGGGFKKVASAAWSGSTSALGGAMRGIGSGSKGKVFGGASSVISQNRKLADANRSGATMFGMFGAGLAQKFGFRDSYEQAKADYDANKQLVSDAKATEDLAMDIANKQAGNLLKDANGNIICNRDQNGKMLAAAGGSAQEFIDLANARQAYQNAQNIGGDVAKAEAELKAAEKKAREKVINDTINRDISANRGYNTDKYDSNHIDGQKLIHSIQVSDDQAKALGASMFTTDNAGNKSWNKDRRDVAESKQLEAQARMNQTQADHEAAQRKGGN